MTRRLTDLLLERYLADALPSAQKAEVAAVLAASPDDAEALRVLQADTAAQWVTSPPAAVARRLVPEKRQWWVWLAPLVAAVVAVFVVLPSKPVEPEMTAKGGVAWAVTLTRDGGTSPLGKEAHAGDVLSFQVTTAERVFAAVLSVAADGVFVYEHAVELKPGSTLLPHAAKLDDTVGEETLVLVTCAEAFDAETLRKRLEADRAAVTGGCSVSRASFVKRAQ
jgi:hypothetical protein